MAVYPHPQVIRKLLINPFIITNILELAHELLSYKFLISVANILGIPLWILPEEPNAAERFVSTHACSLGNVLSIIPPR